MLNLIYPGQGSQQPGMGKFLFDNFKVAKEIFEEASDALQINVKKLCFEASESDLALTENTQPALLTVSTATQKVLRSHFDIKVSSAAGHSIGEYAALVSSESIRFSDAVKAVRIRGQAMQSAVPAGQGGMLALLGLETDQVATLCAYAVKGSKQGPLSPANFNCPGQIVISGNQRTISWLKDNFNPESIWGADAPKRAKMIPLNVSAPFHCEMMKPAEDKMRQVLNEIEFKDSDFPILQNFNASFESKAENLRENLIRQVSAPVLWLQSMQLMKSHGHLQFIECGTGKVLSGLLKKIDPAFQIFSTNSMEDIKIIEDYVKNLNH